MDSTGENLADAKGRTSGGAGSSPVPPHVSSSRERGMGMLATLRGKAAGTAAAVIVAGSMLFVGATTADATPIVIAPLIPSVLEDTGAVCAVAGSATLGVACGVAAAGALAYGAWWAFNNQDTVAGWVDGLLGVGKDQVQDTSGQNWGWVSGLPDPSLGPVAGVSASVFSIKCSASSGHVCSALGYTGAYPKVNTICRRNDGSIYLQQLSGPAGGVSSGFTVYAGPGTYTNSLPDPPCVGASVAEVDFHYFGGLIWKASGNWDANQSTTTTVTCKIPGGASASFTQTTTGVVSSSSRTTTIPNCASLDPGSYTTGIGVCTAVVGETCLPRLGYAVKSTAETTYPNCFTGSSPGFGGCVLAVQYQGAPCSDSITACADWWGNAAVAPTSYQCLWGPYTVPLSSCLPLQYSYVPGAAKDPGTGLAVAPVASSSPTAGPGASAAAIPTTGANPLPTSSTGIYAPNPTDAGTGFPSPVPLPPPVVAPPGGQNCMAAAWSWNPVEWVVVPVECALSWAWVPDQAVVQQTETDMTTAWNTSPTGTFLASAWGMFTPLFDLSTGDVSSCGITVAYPFAQGHSMQFTLLNNCTEPWSTYAPWVKGFLTAAVLYEGAYAVIRALGIGFGIGVPPRAPEQLSLF